jgi:hypothetical protein
VPGADCAPRLEGGIIKRMAQQRSTGDVAKFAVFTIVWGIVAVASFVALPWVVDKTGQTATGGNIALSLFGTGPKNVTNLTQQFTSVLAIILAIPIAGLVLIVLGIVARVRVPSNGQIALQAIVAVIGLLATIFWFIPNVIVNPDDQHKFIQAGIIVAATVVLTRLRQPVMNFFSDNPTIASVLTLALAYAAFWLANQANFTSVVLTQLGLWLTLAAFGLEITGAWRLNRSARKVRH